MVKIYAIKILFFVFSVQLLFQETSSAGRILGILKDYANLKDVDETLAFIYRNYRREQKLQRNVQSNTHKKESPGPRNPHLQLHSIGPAHSTIYEKLFGSAERTASVQQQLAQLKISQKTSALIGELFILKIKEKENREMENLGNVAEGEQSAVGEREKIQNAFEDVEKLLVEDEKFMGEVKNHGFQLKGKQGLAVVLDDKKNEAEKPRIWQQLKWGSVNVARNLKHSLQNFDCSISPLLYSDKAHTGEDSERSIKFLFIVHYQSCPHLY